jgi:DNA-binding MarR family transcriptional regulator
MTDPSLAAHIDQAAAIVRDLVRLRPRLKLALPPALARAKAQVNTLDSAGDHHALFQVGVVLSSQQESLSMGELSKALDVPLSTATRIADWWVKNGYAERLPDAQDRRVVRVALTRSGRNLLKAGNKLICQRVEQVLRHFTPEERETLVMLMRKLVASLENEEE